MLTAPTSPQRVDTPKGRYYATAFGTFPSVTNVLSQTKTEKQKAQLANWYERNKNKTPDGHQMAENARTRGTYLHGRIERHIAGLPPLPFSPAERALGVQFSWDSVQSHLSRLYNPQYVEVCVYDPKNKYAGTLDVLEQTSTNEFEIWDWKNREERIFDEQYIEDYYCQGAAYAKAVPKCLPGIPRISRVRIIIALTTGPAQEFVLNEKRIDYYYRFFLRRNAKFSSLGKEFSYTPPNRPARRRSK